MNIKNIFLFIVYSFFLLGISGGIMFLYQDYYKEKANERNKFITVNFQKLQEDEKKYLIKKYKNNVMKSLSDKNLLTLKPSEIISKDISKKIKKDLVSFNEKLQNILEELSKRGFIILDSTCVLAGVPDATADIEKILKLKGKQEEDK